MHGAVVAKTPVVTTMRAIKGRVKLERMDGIEGLWDRFGTGRAVARHHLAKRFAQVNLDGQVFIDP